MTPADVVGLPDADLLALACLLREVEGMASGLQHLLEAAELIVPPGHRYGSAFLLRSARNDCRRWLAFYAPYCLAAQLEHERRYPSPDSQDQPLEDQGHDATTNTSTDAGFAA